MTVLNNLRNPLHPGWQVNERQLKAEFNVVGKWPEFGCPPQRLENTVVYVTPRNEIGRRTHRAIAVCGICNAHVSAGRLHQHLKAHPKWLVEMTPDEELDLIEYNNSLRPD